MSELSQTAPGINELIADFVQREANVAHAVVASSDGLPLAFSARLPQDRAKQLAAVAAGLIGLSQDASRIFDGGAAKKAVIEMELGHLLILSIGGGSCLALLAAADCDVELVARQAASLLERLGLYAR